MAKPRKLKLRVSILIEGEQGKNDSFGSPTLVRLPPKSQSVGGIDRKIEYPFPVRLE
jgi:hypothetical protein